MALQGSRVNPTYLATLVDTSEAARQKAHAGQGDAVVHTSSRVFAGVNVAVPPLDEQVAIVDVLVDVDQEIVMLRERLTKARSVKTGLIQELLTDRTRLPVGEEAA